MDKAVDSGSTDAGSIPVRDAKIKKYQYPKGYWYFYTVIIGYPVYGIAKTKKPPVKKNRRLFHFYDLLLFAYCQSTNVSCTTCTYDIYSVTSAYVA